VTIIDGAESSPASSLLRRLTAAAAATLGVAGFVALLGEYGHRQITLSRRSDFRDDPLRLGLDTAEEIELTAADGIRLKCWLFRSPTATASVIALHGHGGNRHHLLPIAQLLYPDFHVLLLDHRGHGESDGLHTTIGYEERLDVPPAVDFLVGRGLGPVGIYGMSMGGAIAIQAAVEDQRIAAVLVDSPFARLRWAVQQSANLRGWPKQITPFLAYLGCLTTALHLHYRMQAFDPVEVVDRLAPRPIFIVHGTEDDVVPVASAHALYERAGHPKELWLLEGLKHCQALDERYDEFRARVLGFYRRWLREPDVGTPGHATAASSVTTLR
jgi:alpha-beta hydrolase superfamily lysophospholipase